MTIWPVHLASTETKCPVGRIVDPLEHDSEGQTHKEKNGAPKPERWERHRRPMRGQRPLNFQKGGRVADHGGHVHDPVGVDTHRIDVRDAT